MQLFVKDLTVIDFSYLCPIRGMVGESWIVDVLLDGGLDQQNMVLDFGKVKKLIKHVIDDVADHRLLIPTACSKVRWQQQNERVWMDFDSKRGSIHLACPTEAFALVPAEIIDFDSVNAFLQKALRDALPDNVAEISLTLRNEMLDTPFYHYSHGLKKHDGNCQRIAHGHRSPIKVFEDGASAPEWDKYWADRWHDIYLGTEEDLVAIETMSLSPQTRATDASHYGFHYQAPQGDFQLAIAKDCCEIIPHDTTIELLAKFMADTLAAKVPGKQFRVMAFEGIGKGAIANAQVERS
ncbi:6-carboxytetrahydropterin synthase [Shewanella sp. C32]|uniref:6-carboxy-5,6,7,8-tetrahydropterin synthase n=1 Tax=Shewanella electrica TaxID=515560 RepID=A0ABT2FL03_9GAMM|nr:6-carboxytetrahydropterin synthase [Shewanella electrica]MCH1923791.1 6-carboxytetrahydropterin synthase [Shewanella electrica]MCS4557009.1 6-carboxytetrahydropterin synthase [Shewanella electrica]